MEQLNVDEIIDIADEVYTRPSQATINLYHAIESRNIDLIKQIIDDDDCDVAYQDESTGASPLMIAAGIGSVDIIALLLEDGAPWNAVDRQYRCAGDYALMNGHQDCVDALLRHAAISEMLLGRATYTVQRSLNADYLANEVSYEGDKLMDSHGLAVMMDWERELMEKHAAFICHADRLIGNEPPTSKAQRRSVRVLNVGFGMGIVDTAIQRHQPTEHVIIEAHPAVHARMLSDGWADRPGVRVLFGRWQDVLAKEMATCEPFDGIFFDTYAEDDQDLRDFHTYLPRLLRPETGRYSFYNGLCPDNAFFHAVACEVTRLELNHMHLRCDFEAVKVDVADHNLWKGVKKRYWYFDTYYLPKCYFKVIDCTK